MIEFLRNFVGTAPALSSPYDITALAEYIVGSLCLLAVMLSIYAIFGTIIHFLKGG